MKTFRSEDIQGMEKRFRANFINSITGFKSANLIGSVYADGKSNLAIFSSVVHMSSNPPIVGFITRPTHVERHTYHNILEKKYYTVNGLPENLKKEGHKSAANYPKGVSEFDKTEFTPLWNYFGVPYVKESAVSFTCELKTEIPIELNGTILMVGQIVEARVSQEIIGPDGFLDLAKAGLATISGSDSYHGVSSGVRFSYARPDEPISTLSQ